MSKGTDRMTVQSSNDFSKAAEHLLNKTEVTHILQVEISSRISGVIEWNMIKSGSLDQLMSTLLHAIMGIQFRYSNILIVKKWQNSTTKQMKV